MLNAKWFGKVFLGSLVGGLLSAPVASLGYQGSIENAKFRFCVKDSDTCYLIETEKASQPFVGNLYVFNKVKVSQVIPGKSAKKDQYKLLTNGTDGYYDPLSQTILVRRGTALTSEVLVDLISGNVTRY